jgi:hypothetical protein
MNDNMMMRQVDAAEMATVEGGNFIGSYFNGLLNPNPEDSREPHGPIGPVSRVGVSVGV